jgi:hypothetical protein
MRALKLIVPLLGAGVLLGGCSDEVEQGSPSVPAPAAQAKASVFTIEEYDDADLPGTGRTMGPLDDGHLSVSIPDEWFAPPRSSKWLMRVQFVPEQTYPTIIVTGGENAEGVEQLDKSNLKDFAEKLQAELAEKRRAAAGADADVPEVVGVKIGDFYAVKYHAPAVAGGTSLTRLMILTIQKGREYHVELRALRGTLSRFQPEALAVAARMKVE